MTREDVAHLKWVFDRLVEVYKESPNLDYMIRFGEIIHQGERGILLFDQIKKDRAKETSPAERTIGEITQKSSEEKQLIMQKIQVLTETMAILYDCDQLDSVDLVGEKLMTLVNKLVPTE